MLTNLRVRVESDPMRVPLAASMQLGRADTFANALERAVAERQPVADEPQRPAVEPAPAAATAAERGDEATADEPVAEVEEPAVADAPVGEPSVVDLEQAATAAAPAAKVVDDSPKPAQAAAPKPRSAEPLVAAIVTGGVANGPRTTTAAPATPAVAAVGGAKAGTAVTRGGDAPLARAGVPARAAAVAAGYRTSATASAQLLEQSRDSVFKQILLKLDAQGGEMRMRLEPPDLGELDLRMVVEHGNRLTLSIAAERNDVAQLLQQHLDALKQTLQAAGLDVADAQISARDDRRRQTSQEAFADASGDPDDALPGATTITPRLGGYVGAEGLDFWV